MSSPEAALDDEAPSVRTVSSLVKAQFPEFGSLEISIVASAGTDNAMYRLGAEHVARLPRNQRAAVDVQTEQRWLPLFASRLPIAVPVPVGLGRPAPGFDSPWSIYRWIDGTDAYIEPIAHCGDAAIALGRFGAAMRRVEPDDAPPSFRGGPLSDQEVDILAAIEDASLRDVVDRRQALDAWRSIRDLPQWNRAPLWCHGDLLPGNLLVRDGRLCAVIDFGRVGAGDPACDLMAAWTVFDAVHRDVFREHSEIDDATWDRGRGWAFGFGLMAYHYHRLTNPVLAAVGRRAAEQSLAEF